MKGKFYSIGVGPGDPDLLTLKAVKILQTIDVVAVPESRKEAGSVAFDIAKPHLKEGIKCITLTFPMIKDEQEKAKYRTANGLKIVDMVKSGRNVAFLTLGDPMLYSTYIYLLDTLVDNGVEIVSIPGIYSFCAISNGLNLPLVKGDERLAVISSFDIEKWANLSAFQTVVCMKVSSYKQILFDTLSKDTTWRFLMVTNAGKASEVVSTNFSDLLLEVPYFSTVILSKTN